MRLKINGRVMPAINLARGFSQGTPEPSLLFSLVLSPLVNTIAKDLQGLEVNNKIIKTCSYIDDMTFKLRSPEEAHWIFNTLCLLSQISGVQVNHEKSKTLVINANNMQKYAGIFPIVNENKILGIK